MPTATEQPRRLRPVLVHDKNALDASAVGEQLADLTAIRPWRNAAAVLGDWAVIAIAITVAVHFHVWYISLAAIVAIATRQHALLVLLHDAAHYRFCENKPLNDRLCNWLISYPCFTSVDAYRVVHLAHHFHVNTDEDPDWIRKQGKREWVYPKSPGGVAAILLKQMAGVGAIYALMLPFRYTAAKKSQPAAKETAIRKAKSDIGERAAFYVISLAVILLLGGWKVVLLYWVVPFLTVFPFIMRVRSLSEHLGLYDRATDLTNSRNYHCSLIEQWLFAPHNVYLHLDHHLFPTIPFYNLPAAHKLLGQCEQYRAGAHENTSILLPSPHSVISDLTAGSRANRLAHVATQMPRPEGRS